MTVAGPAPLVVQVEDTETQRRSRYAFLKSPVRLGRSEINELQLDRPYVSTWHGVVQFDRDRVTFVDLGSTNGTTLAGTRLEKNVPVEIGPADELRIGGLRLRFATEGAADAAPAPRRATQFRSAVAARADALRPGEADAPGPVSDGGGAGGASAAPEGGAAGTAAPADGAEQAREVPPPRDPADDPAGRAADDAAWQLQVLQDAWLDARRVFEEAAAAVVERVPGPDRPRCRALLETRYLAARRGPSGAPPAATPPAVAAAAADDVSILREFAGAYLPAGDSIEDGAQAQAFLEAVADVLETSARSYLELRRGYDEFGKEMGLRVATGDGPVARARDTRQLLAWLLAPSEQPRAPELSGAFADLMIHQLALLNAVTEGGKALLAGLSPEAIAASLEREGAGRVALGVKTLRDGALWRTFVERYRALTEEEGALTDALFGKDFARAYSAAAGRRAARDGEGDAAAADPEPAGPGRPSR